MRFSRQGYWSGLPFPSPGDLPNPGIEPGSLVLQADSLPTELIIKKNAQQSGNGMELKQIDVNVYIKPIDKVMNNGEKLNSAPKGRNNVRMPTLTVSIKPCHGGASHGRKSRKTNKRHTGVKGHHEPGVENPFKMSKVASRTTK